MAHRGRHRSRQASVESSDAPTYEENLVERLARSLERSGFTGVTVDQARRLRGITCMERLVRYLPTIRALIICLPRRS